MGTDFYIDKTSWDKCQEEFPSKLSSGEPVAGQILLCSTDKPQLLSERGRGTRKENELNQIPHPNKSYHASGGVQNPAASWDAG